MAEYIAPPNVSGATTQEQIRQISEFLTEFISKYNYMIAEYNREINEIKGKNNYGNL